MTETPQLLAEAPQFEVLRSMLERLRIEGAIFFRSELTDEFAFESTPLALVDALAPGSDRLILFHIVASGSCWVEAAGTVHWANEGDVIVLPYGDRHTLGGATPAEPVSILSLLDPLPWADLPVLRHGGGGARTDLVCGYLHSDDPLFDPALRALPPVFVVRLPAGAAREWVQASVDYAMDESRSSAKTRLAELVLIEVLGQHLESAPAADEGWLSALRDPVLSPALALLHESPAHAWTVSELAARVAVSRSLLDARFRAALHRSPIRYLTEWRMHLADQLLATTDITVAEVGRRVGYASEDAFSRAFKRERGLSPTYWRLRDQQRGEEARDADGPAEDHGDCRVP